MNWTEFNEAVNDAKLTMRRADRATESLAYIMVGRLRLVDDRYTLASLKKELRSYNSVTGEWKEEK